MAFSCTLAMVMWIVVAITAQLSWLGLHVDGHLALHLHSSDELGELF